jgi:HAD superfamily hydrolase (TIGR01549 family)
MIKSMNNRRFEAIIFDLGNTLIYFDGEWSQVLLQADQALLQSLRDSGLALEDNFGDVFRERLERYYREREMEFIEYTTWYILRSLLEDWGYMDVSDDTIRQALSELHSVSQAHWLPEDDMMPTLSQLQAQNYRLGMISNAGDDADVQALVDKAKIRPFFDIILTSASLGIRKPNPEIFKRVLDYWKIQPSRVVMVGDTLGADILGAKNAGIFSIWITRRANTPANLAHQDTIWPDARISQLNELPGLLESL